MLDDDPGGVAVEAGVVGEHGDQVLGLVLDVAAAPGAGHHDHRAHVAQLRTDRLVQDRAALGLALGALGAGAEGDRLDRAVRTGDMDGVDLRVVAEVAALLGAAVDQSQEAGLDQGGEALGHQRPQVVVHRVHLVDHHLVVDEQLVE